MASWLTRRSVLRTAGATAAAAAISAPFVHGAYAAGQLKLGFGDHWVPGGNDALTKRGKEWGEKESNRLDARTAHELSKVKRVRRNGEVAGN